MCGRYTLAIDKSTIKKHFGAKFYIAKVATTTKPPTSRALADAADHPHVRTGSDRAREVGLLAGGVVAFDA
jgi:hypothetical protein